MSSFANVAELLLTPVQIAIYLLFLVSLFEAGRMVIQWGMRAAGRRAFSSFIKDQAAAAVGAGYPIARLYCANRLLSVDELDVVALRRLEFIRVATRITPMLGLMATLIPMGPALVALTKNDVTQMSELLRLAFSSVVLALASACLCFWIASVRRRWCAEELVAVKLRVGRGS